MQSMPYCPLLAPRLQHYPEHCTRALVPFLRVHLGHTQICTNRALTKICFLDPFYGHDVLCYQAYIIQKLGVMVHSLHVDV